MLNPLEVAKVLFYLSGMTSRPLGLNLSKIVKHMLILLNRPT